MMLPAPVPILSLLSILFSSITAAPTAASTNNVLDLQDGDSEILSTRSAQSPLNHEAQSQTQFRIPTRYESTVLARRLLALSKTGTLSTIFPHNISSPYVPHSVHDTPIGLPDYIASCEEPSGNPTLLALTISTSTRNAVAGSNVSLALSWWDEYIHLTHRQPWSAASLPRASLVGYLEEMSEKDVNEHGVVDCFLDNHNDAKLWLPGDKGAAHKGVWMRLVVEEVYWVGGFGDRAFIGWFKVDEWRKVSRKEWSEVRLPGEDVEK